jgi:chemotaxis protein histidine kinase CheA
MDTPASAAPDEKTSPPEEALASQPSKEKSNPASPLELSTERFNSSVARLTTNSIDELHKLVSELQKMQEFLKSEVDSVQRQIDSAVAGINIIVETIGPWKNIAGSQTLPSGTRNVRAGGPAANIEQRIRVG